MGAMPRIGLGGDNPELGHQNPSELKVHLEIAQNLNSSRPTTWFLIGGGRLTGTYLSGHIGHGMQGRPLQRSLSDVLLLVLCI
jgi:hypothetical protein